MIEAFEHDQTVVLSRHRKNIFTMAGYINIDHNTQHPDHNSDGDERHIDLDYKTASTSSVKSLPFFYTEKLDMNWENVAFISSVSTNESDFEDVDLDLVEEEDWLKSVNMCLSDQDALNISWAASHVSKVRS